MVKILKRKRKLLKIPGRVMADALGVCYQTFLNYEKGNTIPTIDIVEAWAKKLGYELLLTEKA
jgi:transcriptional regulator with XRE-family HTH domain